MNPSVMPKAEKKRSYTVKQKLLPSILLSLAIPLTVCFFGPFDIFYANMAEFRYSLLDFMPLCAVAVLIATAVFFALLMLLRGRAYEICSGVILAVSILLFAQRSFMNMGVDALVGDGRGTYSVDLLPLILNTLVWVAVIAAAVLAEIFLRQKHSEIVETVTVIAMITFIGMQAISMTIFSVTTDVWTPVDERKEMTDVLSFDGIDELSGEKNVVVFIVDRFDSAYYDQLVESDPEFFDGLDGFTYYNDYTSLYSRTYPSVTSILTGKDNDFSTTRLEYFKNAYADGGHMKTLKEKGYDVNLYTKEYYAYENASVMDDYVGNTAKVEGYYIKEPFFLCGDMIRLSFSSYLPFIAKGAMGYMSTPDFNNHAEYILVDKDGGEGVLPYDSDLKTVKDYISDTEFKVVDGVGKFTFIHLDGCHTPIKYDENWDEKWNEDTDVALKLNFEIIYAYIEEMKTLGIYESSTIVITGDHAWSVDDDLLIGEGVWDKFDKPEAESDTEKKEDDPREEDSEEESTEIGIGDIEEDRGVRVTSMFFKRSGDAGTELRTSTAQISQDELWNTILESEGYADEKNGLSFFDIPEGEDRERRYLLQIDADALKNQLEEDQIVEYKIVGTALDPENWEIVNRIDIGDFYK